MKGSMLRFHVSFFVCLSLALRPVSGGTVSENIGWLYLQILQRTDELTSGATAVIIIIFLYCYWDRVVFALTGDDRFHIDCLGALYFSICRCCGCCTGDWTRYFTCCSCLPRRWQRMNCFVETGKWLGLFPRQIMLSNIVVGDIPYDGLGDFYLTVDCAENPPMVTAVQEEVDPSVVHFPETIFLNIRDTAVADSVVIRLKQLNFMGSDTLCDIYFQTTSLLDWAGEKSGYEAQAESEPEEGACGGCCGLVGGGDQGPRPLYASRRFKMRPHTFLSGGVTTPPWILCEVTFPDEVVFLSQQRAANGYIRVLDDEKQEEESFWGSLFGKKEQTVDSSWVSSISGAHLFKQHDRTVKFKEYDMGKFRSKYPCHDATGQLIGELDEREAWCMETAYACVRWCLCLAMTVYILAAAVAWGFRYYYLSCWQKYRRITMANLKGRSFPMSTPELLKLEDDCTEFIRGTGIEPGEDACLPSDKDVLDTCHSPPPRVGNITALRGEVYRSTGQEIPGIPCSEDACKMNHAIKGWDGPLAIATAVIVVVIFCFTGWVHTKIRKRFNRMQMAKNNRQEE